jgi:hypothetical protein
VPRLTKPPALASSCAFSWALVLVAPAVFAAPPRWSIDSRVGYGASFTTAQSYLGAGTGVAAGVTFGVPLHVELGATWYAGSIVSAENASIVYWSRDWSVLAQAAAGWDFSLLTGRLVARPQIVLGAAFVSDTTLLAGEKRHTLEPRLTIGPGAALLVHLAGVHVGFDGRASFVPSWVAAPIGEIGAVVGWQSQ